MALIYLTIGKSTYIMVDGFISPHTKSKGDIANKVNELDDKLFTLKYSNIDCNKSIFIKCVEQYRNGFCNNWEKKESCYFENCFNSSEIKKMLLQSHYKKNSWMDLGKYFSSLSSEHNNDIKKGKDHYVQNIIIIEQPVCNYPTIKLCCLDWVKKTGFKFKAKTEYLNYNNFVSAWLDILSKLYGGVRGSGIGSIRTRKVIHNL